MSRARIFWAGWFLAFGILSAIWPRDAGFDVLHYHLHNGWSALNGRLHTDLAPAEMHSFLNPAWNVLAWWLIERLPGPVVAFLLAMPQAAILPTLYGLSLRLSRAVGREMTVRAALLIAALGFACAPAYAVFASLRNDELGALAFLLALYLALPARGKAKASLKALALGAAILGAVASAKLTNVIYIPAFAVFALAVQADWRARIHPAMVCASAGMAAFALLAGPWMWTLWSEFANPVYPNLAGVFPGPEAASDASRDTRYLPGSLGAAIGLPVAAALDGQLINENPVRDLRLAVTYLGALWLLGLALIARISPDRPALPRKVVALAGASLLLIAVWMGLFAIQRYALGAWMLAPLIAWCLLDHYRGALANTPYVKGATLAAVGVLVFSVSPEKMRRVGWSAPAEPYVSITRPDTLTYNGALVLIASAFPAGFTATAFPEARIAHIDAQNWSAPFLENYRPRIDAAIRAQSGPLYLVHCQPGGVNAQTGETFADIYTPQTALAALAPRHTLRVSDAGCQPLPTNLATQSTTWQICLLENAGGE